MNEPKYHMRRGLIFKLIDKIKKNQAIGGADNYKLGVNMIRYIESDMMES